MTKLYTSLLGAYLLTSFCNAALTTRDPASYQGHKHSDTDLDVVQCQHSFYRIDQNSGKPELVSGQESRLDPSRQYLPQPDSPRPKEEEAPAASFDQPNILSVDKTLVSPSLQNNYRSLFGNKPDTITPAAAQNVPSNALAPTPRKISSKKHDEDDEDNLERLCNDAFHSFLCKPIKGPRKTPTGRIRANAVIPPDVLAGFSTFQEETRVRPESPRPQTNSNRVEYSFSKPTTTPRPPPPPPPPPQPSNQFPQRLPFPSQFSTTQRTTTTQVPFENVYKPDFPSPTNNNPTFLKPQPSNESPFSTAAQTNGYVYEKPNVPFPPQVGNPSNQNQQLIPPRTTYPTTTFRTTTFRPTTQRPVSTTGYSYDKPIIPFPSNNVPQISPFSKTPKPVVHDCEKHTNQYSHETANPTNDNPAFLKPYNPSTPKPYQFPKSSLPFTSNNNFQKIPPAPKVTTPKPDPTPECDKHQHPYKPVFGNPTNQNPIFLRPTTQTTQKPHVKTYIDNTRIPQPSDNIAQILAQPQQNAVSVAPQVPSGYFYNKPAIPFPPPPQVGNPSNRDPSVAQRPTQRPTYQPTTAKPSGYVYEQPRIPFPSNNIAQVISQPTPTSTPARPFITSPTPNTPCQHDKSPFPSNPFISNPTNQNSVVVKPSSTSDAYVYSKPSVPFPESFGPSDQDSIGVRPSTPKPFSGYSYDKPANPFLLPNPTNNSPSFVASPANNGYNYQKPDNPFPSTLQPVSTIQTPSTGYSYKQPRIPFPPNIQSKLASANDEKPNFLGNSQNNVDVTVRPGYSYNKPNNPLRTPQPTNQDPDVQGYSYPKPSAPYIR